MSRLIISQHIKAGAQTAVNQLAVQSNMIEVAMHNKHCTAFTCLLRQPEIMHHDLVITCVYVTLMVGNVRVLHPEIQTVKRQ